MPHRWAACGDCAMDPIPGTTRKAGHHGPCRTGARGEGLPQRLRGNPRFRSGRSRWRALGAGGAVGLRQDHHPADDRRPGTAHPRHDYNRLHSRQPRAAQRPRRGHGLSEPRPLPPLDGLPEHGLRTQAPQKAEDRDRFRGSPGRGYARDRALAGAEAEAALGRAASAGSGGEGHRPPTLLLPVRRAPFKPRRPAPRPDAGRAEAAPPAARYDHHLRNPRPARGAHARRSRGGGSPGPHAADRNAAGSLPSSGQPVRGRIHRPSGDELPRRQDHGARRPTLVRVGRRADYRPQLGRPAPERQGWCERGVGRPARDPPSGSDRRAAPQHAEREGRRG